MIELVNIPESQAPATSRQVINDNFLKLAQYADGLPGLTADYDEGSATGTDNTPIVNAAIAAGTVIIKLPPGNFMFSGEITPTPGLVFVASSESDTTVWCKGSGVFLDCDDTTGLVNVRIGYIRFRTLL